MKKINKVTFTLNKKNKVKTKILEYNKSIYWKIILRVGIYGDLISEGYEDYNLKMDELIRISSKLFKSVSRLLHSKWNFNFIRFLIKIS